MTKDLYYTIPRYFLDRMEKHSNVADIEDISDDDFFIYRITRAKQRDQVLVWLSDAYSFTEMDYVNRPEQLNDGDYILIARPEGGGGASDQTIEDTKIGVGKLAELMGALTKNQMWTYLPPDYEEKKKRSEKFAKFRDSFK